MKKNAPKQEKKRSKRTRLAVVSQIKQKGTLLPPGYPVNEFDFEVAELAWTHGLSANSILEFKKMKKDAHNITKVRRALERVVRHGYLVLNLPPNDSLKEKLKGAFPTAGNIEVEIDRTGAYLKAARIIADEIQSFLGSDKEEMIIANAGGRTVRDCVDYLQRLVPAPPQIGTKKLTFLSLNAAEAHDRYDECANFLSVRMAQIYNARHFAAVRSWDLKTQDEYNDKLKNIDLLISSAGTLSNASNGPDKLLGAGFLAHWIHSKKRELPAEAVGEIAFHLIDKRGHQVVPSDDIRTMIDDDLLRKPDWNDLTFLFRQHKVLLVLVDNKVDVGYAVLDSALSQRTILDSQLAQLLVNRKQELTHRRR